MIYIPSDLKENQKEIIKGENLVIDFVIANSILAKNRKYLRALNDVSFTLYTGRSLAVVGESGSGKSTIAKIIARVYKQTEGKLFFKQKTNVDDIEVSQDIKSYKQEVQMVFQDPFGSLNPLHTIFYHLARPLKIYKNIKNRKELEERVYSSLEGVGLLPAKEVAQKFPHQLSGGQRQRVFLARVLTIGANLILADEPTSMLDVSIRIGVLNLMNKMKEEYNKSFMYITHDIATARYFAEDTAVLYAGHMLEWGNTESVTQTPAHPYTQLLISAAPNPKKSIRDSLEKTIAKTDIPMWTPNSKGCPFRLRCPHFKSICEQELPVAKEVTKNHFSRCHLHS